MRKYGIVLMTAFGLLFAAVSAGAQAPGGALSQGFNAQTLIVQLSLYLPEDSTRGMYGGFGGRGGQGGQGGQAAQGARRFPQIQFTRDPKLFLTKDQIAKLLPILLGLRENPMPTPSKAKQVQAGVDEILTVAQKAEYADFQRQVQKMIQISAGRWPRTAEAPGNGQGFGGGQGTQSQGGNGGTQMTPLQRRQRQSTPSSRCCRTGRSSWARDAPAKGKEEGVVQARILIIEDVKEMADLIRLYLQKEGMDATICETAEDGLAQFAETRYDLVDPGHQPPGDRRVRVPPAAAQDQRRARDDRLRARRRRGHDPGPGDRGGRVRHQAVLPQGARGARARHAPAHHGPEGEPEQRQVRGLRPGHRRLSSEEGRGKGPPLLARSSRCSPTSPPTRARP